MTQGRLSQIMFSRGIPASSSPRMAARQNHEVAKIHAGQLRHDKFGVPEIPTTTFVEGTWFAGKSCPI